MTSYYAIISQDIKPSKNGGEMITIIALDIESRDECISYLDPSMKNFLLWEHIITQPERGFVVTGLKRKARLGAGDRYVLNADCEPIIVKEFDNVKSMERRLRSTWAKMDFEATPFGRMFGDASDKS